MRYALRYVPWTPPSVPAMRRLGMRLMARLAGAAARRRHTLAGRILFGIAPKSLRTALRARLK